MADPSLPPSDAAPPSTPHRGARLAVVMLAVVGGLAAGLVVADLTTPGDEAGTGGVAAGPEPTAASATPGGTGGGAGAADAEGSERGEDAARPDGDATGTTATEPSTSSTGRSTTSTAPTTIAPVTTAPPTTRPAVTTTTAAPPIISVSYLQDPTGALALPARGAATITLVNSGGTPGQWLLDAAGPDLGLSTVQGTIAPRETVTVTVTDLSGQPRSTSISGFVAPSQRVTIAVRVGG